MSALIVGETVRVEPMDVVVQLDADVAVLDAAGCDAMTDMIERKDIRRALGIRQAAAIHWPSSC